MGRRSREIDKFSGYGYPIDLMSEDLELNNFYTSKQRDQRNDIRYKSSKMYRIQGHAFNPIIYAVGKDYSLHFLTNRSFLINRRSRDYLPIEFW